MPTLKWSETFTTTNYYTAEISAEEAELFNTNEEKFFEEVDYSENQELSHDDIEEGEPEDFSVED